MKHKGPVLVAILDGFGLDDTNYDGNAIAQAKTPNFDRYRSAFPNTQLSASGVDVGLPLGQMGNSEVGHLNIGAGRVVFQDLTRINKAIADGSFFDNRVICDALGFAVQQKSAIHLCGLLSDGGVHSHIEHLRALLESIASVKNPPRTYIHAFLDGRDTPPRSAIQFITQLEKYMSEIGVGEIATLHGRYWAMDRDKRWERIEKSYRLLFHGEGEHYASALQALQLSYDQGISDEFLVPCFIGPQPTQELIAKNDVIFSFNFRPDRAVQLATKLANNYLVSMTQIGDSITDKIIFPEDKLTNTLGEVVSRHGLKQLRIAETEKYPHVTYFLNGGRELPWPGEERILVPSPKVATYDLQPQMSAYELTDILLKQLTLDKYDMIILNFANPDMVGHSGMLGPTIAAVEAVDELLGQIVDAVLALGGRAVITADHGNADKVLDENGMPFTAHTLAPVPLIITDSSLQVTEGGILADIAPTVLELLGIETEGIREMTGKSLLR